jgi:TetR/AcrR family transcriptional regulator, fatty acid metabolism regulator protein
MTRIHRGAKRGRPQSIKRPPGYTKIIEALKSLLKEKGFQDITWSEIARKAGVSEALIYQYFKTRQGLLYAVLKEYLAQYHLKILTALDESQGALNKIKTLIHCLISVYNDNRVFARILLLEVRNFQDYYDSEAYALIRDFGRKYMTALDEGMAAGEIRSDVPAHRMRQVLLGGVEHSILPYVIFQKDISTDELTRDITPMLIDAIKHRP